MLGRRHVTPDVRLRTLESTSASTVRQLDTSAKNEDARLRTCRIRVLSPQVPKFQIYTGLPRKQSLEREHAVTGLLLISKRARILGRTRKSSQPFLASLIEALNH